MTATRLHLIRQVEVPPVDVHDVADGFLGHAMVGDGQESDVLAGVADLLGEVLAFGEVFAVCGGDVNDGHADS